MRCGGTFFIYTKKLLTSLAWLANLCATNFPCLRVWEKITTWKASERDLTSSMRWPKEAKDSWLLQRALITTSEYPSKTIERKPRSWANFKALSAASASNSATKGGREIFFFFFFFFPKLKLELGPLQSRIITPMPASPDCLKTAPSKFTLRKRSGEKRPLHPCARTCC